MYIHICIYNYMYVCIYIYINIHIYTYIISIFDGVLGGRTYHFIKWQTNGRGMASFCSLFVVLLEMHFETYWRMRHLLVLDSGFKQLFGFLLALTNPINRGCLGTDLTEIWLVQYEQISSKDRQTSIQTSASLDGKPLPCFPHPIATTIFGLYIPLSLTWWFGPYKKNPISHVWLVFIPFSMVHPIIFSHYITICC